MDYLAVYLSTFLELFKSLWIWFLIGFIVAAVIQEFVSTKRLLKYFGSNDHKSLLRATFSGLVMSICSCGAIALAAMLRNRGASTATTLTFLLASPWAGFVHIFIIASFVGFRNAFILVIVSLIIAFISGLIFARLENKGKIEQKLRLHKHVEGERVKCEHCVNVEEMKHKEEGFFYRIFHCVPKNMLFISRDVGKYILIGLLLAAVLKAFVPVSLVENIFGDGGRFIPILIALPISAVIELCSEGFTILAGQLYAMGATLGVILTMIMVGVTTDLTELSLIFGKFGRKSGIAYLTITTSLVVLFAFLVNLLF